MLSHPMSHRMMVTEAISGLNLDFFDNIYFICLQEHEDKYSFMKGFVAELDDAGLRAKSNVVLLLNKQIRNLKLSTHSLVDMS